MAGEWSLGDSYDPNQFFYLGTNKKGFDKELPRTHVPPEIVGEIGEVVAKRRFPFTSSQQVVRYGIAAGLATLAHLDPDDTKLQAVVSRLLINNDIENVLAAKQAKERILAECEKLAYSRSPLDRKFAIDKITQALIYEEDPEWAESFRRFLKQNGGL